ncbi:MAG: hypothetical protein L6R42_008971 [Xanthoria sp. 1 TBL-2021]|nr:MAG: hypothetical protein L6R42_008971 [Xanthoria sp. 1 TBL-2021]
MTAKEEVCNDGGVADSERVLLLQDTGVVTVRVGSSNDTWTIHRRLLTHHSPFFAAALNGSFNESTTKTVELIEDDPSAFMLFVLWLYSGEPKFNSNDGLPKIACLA